jgi:hypothetical protein
MDQTQIDKPMTFNNLKETMINFFTFFASLTIVISNKVMIVVVRNFTEKEKHQTLSDFNMSVASKLTLARFVNTVIVPCSLSYQYENWFTRGGLLTDILFITFAVAFCEPFANIFNPFYLLKVFKRWKIRR